MNVKLNNEEVQIKPVDSLLDVLIAKDLNDKTGIAVAVNNVLIPKPSWKDHSLVDNDKIIVITATAGG